MSIWWWISVGMIGWLAGSVTYVGFMIWRAERRDRWEVDRSPKDLDGNVIDLNRRR